MNALTESPKVAELIRRDEIQAPPSLIPQNMVQALELANLMSKGKLVPQHLQGSPADCLMVIEHSARWRMSPFAVAQCTSSIKGKLMFEGKLVAAAINTSGVLQGRLKYAFKGDGDKRSVIVSATIRGDAEPSTVEVALKDVLTDNGCWKKQPDQQLCYAGARVWGRRHAPEVMLGVYTPEEDFDEIPQVTTTGPGAAALPPQVDEKPAYPHERFLQKFASWKLLIEAGEKTADDVIATVESKATLTEEQKSELRKLKKVEKAEGAAA